MRTGASVNLLKCIVTSWFTVSGIGRVVLESTDFSTVSSLALWPIKLFSSSLIFLQEGWVKSTDDRASLSLFFSMRGGENSTSQN